ncbi:hypothetical protein GTZ78_51275 [Streptomyces sp. SID8361]|uniref:hypothetical protein n=1 Tax=Streptomyces TaxID=1883 RepID=UPI00081D796E|nr:MULTISPECIES: hypothetical protein [unclassified Streptomyces]AUA10299.1 hypothetical protein CFP59_02397 [Streptomyces sp. M56]MYU18856.1 hypothetical protein [Streptomyces sp. SID8361]MYX54235.1 hypothetical protein [Streptomyces sp. SID8382]SCG13263.1 hypothetical protein GA0115260_124301 [Streptomyces sp. MnatMP-M27]
MNQDGLEFPARFDQEFVLQDRQRGYFGRNVLKGLVDGMEGFLEEKRRTPSCLRWRHTAEVPRADAP